MSCNFPSNLGAYSDYPFLSRAQWAPAYSYGMGGGEVSNYQFGEVALTVEVQHCGDVQAVRQLIAELCWMSPVAANRWPATQRLSLHLLRHQLPIVSSIQSQLPRQCAGTLDPGNDGFWMTPTGIYFACSGGGIEVCPEGHAEGLLDEGFWHNSLYDRRCLFLRTLITLLRQRGIYSLHASALQLADSALADDPGVLIVGRSGAGKTTLTLGLIDAGWHFLGDNVVGLFQESTTGLLQALAFQRGFSCTKETLTFFPHLHRAQSRPLGDARGKQLVFVETLYPQQFRPQCQPRVLLFPEVTTAAQTTLVSLDETQAMLALLQQSPGLLTDVGRTPAQLQMLRTLVHQTRAYRVLSGRDLITQPAAVGALIAKTVITF